MTRPFPHRYFALFLPLTLFLLSGMGAHAQQLGGHGIPTTYAVVGENIQNGDIVSFDAEQTVYELSRVTGDKNIFGVVNLAPFVVLRSGAGKIPIMRDGDVIVNVTTLGGPIAAGDSITASTIPGKGQRYGSGDGYIVGHALEAFDESKSAEVMVVGGTEVAFGSIRVLLSIGPYQPNWQFPEEVTPSTIFVRDEREVSAGLETIFRYITAALFTLGTIFVVLKTFGPNIGKGVVSIGRNPLARSSIQAMIIFNTVLILGISLVSFIVSLLIIFLPL